MHASIRVLNYKFWSMMYSFRQIPSFTALGQNWCTKFVLHVKITFKLVGVLGIGMGGGGGLPWDQVPGILKFIVWWSKFPRFVWEGPWSYSHTLPVPPHDKTSFYMPHAVLPGRSLLCSALTWL